MHSSVQGWVWNIPGHSQAILDIPALADEESHVMKDRGVQTDKQWDPVVVDLFVSCLTTQLIVLQLETGSGNELAGVIREVQILFLDL